MIDINSKELAAFIDSIPDFDFDKLKQKDIKVRNFAKEVLSMNEEDLSTEFLLIFNKKSKLSANKRQFILLRFKSIFKE